MKKISILWLFTAAVTAASCGPKSNVLTEAEIAEGWTLLFDGTSLDGWRNYNSEKLTGWRVVDGSIQAVSAA